MDRIRVVGRTGYVRCKFLLSHGMAPTLHLTDNTCRCNMTIGLYTGHSQTYPALLAGYKSTEQHSLVIESGG